MAREQRRPGAEDPASVRPCLRVLRCPSCAAPVPLGEGVDARCPFCDAAFPLPAPYRQLRDAERTRAAGRTEADALFRTLGRSPALPLRLLARVPLKGIYLFTFPLLFASLAFVLPPLLAAAGYRFRVNAADVLTNTQFFLLGAALLFVSMGLPLALAAYGHRRANARRRLQEALAALPPERPGGPARCYACGAPLDVPPSAAGASCAYCGADNLVHVAPEWVARLEKGVRSLAGTIESAAREDRAEHAATRRRLWADVAGLFVLLVPPMALLGWALDNDDPEHRWPPCWQAQVAQERSRALIHQPLPPDRYGYALAAHDALPLGRRGRMVYDEAECKVEGGGLLCKRSYLVALRHGDTLTLLHDGAALPPGVTALVVRVSQRRNGLFADDWAPVSDLQTLAPGAPAVGFRAPLDAWYRVDVMSSEEGSRPPAVFRPTASLGR